MLLSRNNLPCSAPCFPKRYLITPEVISCVYIIYYIKLKSPHGSSLLKKSLNPEAFMKLDEFILKYDHENSVVLLEGKRLVSDEYKDKLTKLGRLLALKTSRMIFRSGNADGSDFFFSRGVASVDSSRLQVITPYSGHRKKYNVAGNSVSLEDLDLDAEPEVVRYSRENRKTARVLDQYLSGERDRFSMKAAYIIRDTVKVLGAGHVMPATFGIFYDNPEDPESGGTGHTIRVCRERGIPVIDQSVWLQWIL